MEKEYKEQLVVIDLNNVIDKLKAAKTKSKFSTEFKYWEGRIKAFEFIVEIAKPLK